MGESINIETIIASGQLELYVAGVLPEAEAAEIAALARAHPAIQAEIAAIEAAMYAYAQAAAGPGPGAQVLAQALAQIEAEARDEAEAAPVRPLSRPPRWSWWLAAAVIALLISAVLNVYFYRQWQATDQQLALMESSRQVLAEENSRLTRDLGETEDLMAILHAQDLREVQLEGLPKAPQGQALVLWSPTQEVVLLQRADLPQPPSGYQYQLWAIVEGTPVDAGVFVHAQAWQMLKRIKGRPSAFAVTLEPTGGSESPTLDEMYVIGNMG